MESIATFVLAKTRTKTLEVLQSKMLRIITGAPWFVRNDRIQEDLEVPTLAQFVVHLAKSTLERVLNSANSVIIYLQHLGSDIPSPRVTVKCAMTIERECSRI